MSITPPDPEQGLVLPEKAEPLQLLDVAQTTHSEQVQKALRRLATDKAPTSLSQLVMWRLAGLDWKTISRFSSKWANRYELTLAQDFVNRLDSLPEGETGRVLFQVEGTDSASKGMAAEFGKALKGVTMLGLVAHVGEVPSSPVGPAVSCKVRLSNDEAMVQVYSSDAGARTGLRSGSSRFRWCSRKGSLTACGLRTGWRRGF